MSLEDYVFVIRVFAWINIAAMVFIVGVMVYQLFFRERS